MPDEPFQQSKTHVSLKHKEIKRSANIYENSGSWFSRTTTGIQSGSKSIRSQDQLWPSFSTIIWVTWILCGFRLVLEEKTGKEISES